MMEILTGVTITDLKKKANALGIKKAQIVSIMYVGQQYILVYYA